jgi:hypothetical protein
MLLGKYKNLLKIDKIFISERLCLENSIKTNFSSKDFLNLISQNNNSKKNFFTLRISKEFCLNNNISLNSIYNINKKYLSLGYRAEDLDPKPIKKNKYDNIKLSFGREARDNLLKGIKTVSENVAITYGPLGKNVVIDDKDNPIVTKDGVTVAKHINLTKRKHNLGCRLLSIIAGNTNEYAGDGTTTATVLAGELSK